MPLIKSISGIRGIIGGKEGKNLTPVDVVKFTSAYGNWIQQQNHCKEELLVVIGRDARVSGKMISSLVSNTLIGMGINVLDIGLSTTPTVEISVPMENANGGIILTASHNPKQWNALKLLNHKGEFLNKSDGDKILKYANQACYNFAQLDDLGTYTSKKGYIEKHIQNILGLSLVDLKGIKKAGFKVVVDGVNSTGGIAIPALLDALKVECVNLYCEPNGLFPHNPEPLKENLTHLSERVISEKADLGIAVDPDVDRLAIICEDGSVFGEEYTLVACADYVLSKNKGNTVSNISSTSALRDVTEKYGGIYNASSVGEVNVVELMKSTNAIIGGEGNGGVIYPASHYGRDALVGIALFLSHLAQKKVSCKNLRQTYPNYYMSKGKLELTTDIDLKYILKTIAKNYQSEDISIIDGLKINFYKEWVHLRKSNTEPIIRIYSESTSQRKADHLTRRFIIELKNIIELK